MGTTLLPQWVRTARHGLKPSPRAVSVHWRKVTAKGPRANNILKQREKTALGQLVDGVWHDTWYDTKSTGGAFKRTTAGFRNWIAADGDFQPEAGRYHLYVSYACPWAHRALIFRKLKGLEDLIGVSAVHPDMLSDGWTFERDADGATGDTLYALPFARDIYLKADPTVSGRVTVPILWDTQRETIVSNDCLLYTSPSPRDRG